MHAMGIAIIRVSLYFVFVHSLLDSNSIEGRVANILAAFVVVLGQIYLCNVQECCTTT